MEEFIDIYDENRVFIGKTIPREGASLPEGEFMLYALAIIENHEGKYLITQRSMDKSWGAGWWEITGGGVLTGETAPEAIIREVGEEVGLDASGCEAVPAYTYTNIDPKHGHNYITDIYHFVIEFGKEDVTLQESEAIDCKLVTWDEIEELNEQGVFLHYKRIKTALGK